MSDFALKPTPQTEAGHTALEEAKLAHRLAESATRHRDVVEERLLGLAHQLDALGFLVNEVLQRTQAVDLVHPAALEDRPNLVGISVRDYVSGDTPSGKRAVRAEFVEGTPDTEDDGGRRVDFVYDHPDEGIQQRAILPGEVKVGRSGEYVVGFDLDRNEWRNFRLDRVVRARGSWR